MDDILTYDPYVARKINDKTKSQPHVGVLAAILYGILDSKSGGTDKQINITPKELAKITAFNETQVRGGLQTLAKVGLVKNLTKTGVSTTGSDGLDKFCE